MRSRLGSILMTVIAISLLVDVARAATVDKQKFKGAQAAGVFAATTTITCSDGSAGSVSVSGFLSGSVQISKMSGTPVNISNGIFVEIDFYSNDCTGQSFSGTGGISGGFTAPNKKLNSAGLSGSTLVQDFGTGNQIPVSLDIVIEGTGALTTTKSHSRSRTVVTPGGPVTIAIDHSGNANRSGVASGTISVDGITLTPMFSSVTLNDNANIQVTITKP